MMKENKRLKSKATKRSMAVSLVLMGGASLSACSSESEVDSFVYGSVAQCMQNGVYDQAKCEGDYKQALAYHVETAPAYTSRADCEAEFGAGKCEENATLTTAANAEQGQQQVQSSIGSFFMPMMVGYMMGSMFSNGKQMPPQALYRQNGQSSYVNANGARVANAAGPVKFKSSAAAVQTPKTRTTTLARGGFGARASAAAS